MGVADRTWGHDARDGSNNRQAVSPRMRFLLLTCFYCLLQRVYVFVSRLSWSRLTVYANGALPAAEHLEAKMLLSTISNIDVPVTMLPLLLLLCAPSSPPPLHANALTES